ncbi:hypothetical protein CDS [Bradyrhizobium sp.]|nr:hypothetical protein CDS [Bradyrhizobium sp.]
MIVGRAKRSVPTNLIHRTIMAGTARKGAPLPTLQHRARR